MKSQLIAIVAAVLVVGCATTQSPEPPTAKVLGLPILAAAYNGNIEAVKQHLAAGTDVNVKGGFADGTPLHYAAANGHKEIAELLIEKGADVKAKDEGGKTPLDVAIQFKELEITNLLRVIGGKTGAELKAEGK
jgi:ankyrin repeat protein